MRAPVYTTVGELDRWLNALDPGLLSDPDTQSHEREASIATDAVPAPASKPESYQVGPPAENTPAPKLGPIWSSAPSVPRPVLATLALAGMVAGAIAFAPSGHRAEQAKPAVRPPDTASGLSMRMDPQARENYLNGLHAWNLRTPASLAQARDDVGAAIAHEPGYAPAYAGLANTYLLLREFGTMPGAEAYAKAMAAADAALRLDPQLAAAHRARAFALYWGRRDPRAAWTEFDRAGALAPGEALTWHWYATALDGSGRETEALRMIDRARSLDPTSTAILADKA